MSDFSRSLRDCHSLLWLNDDWSCDSHRHSYEAAAGWSLFRFADQVSVFAEPSFESDFSH